MTAKKFSWRYFLEPRSLPWIIGIVSVVVGIQKIIEGDGFINNFIVFKTSFFHLIHYIDLYPQYPAEYNDMFLYSPTFALLMAPIAYFPIWLELLLWSGLNGMAIYFAIKMLPFDDEKKRIWIIWILFLELITSMQNVQTAPMVSAFIVLAFVFFERKNVFAAAFFILLACCIKIFAIAAVSFFLMYPQRLKFIGYMILWTLIFAVAPLLVISFKQLMFLYGSWYNQITSIHQSEQTGIDPNIAHPLSVMAWLKSWFNFNPPIIYVQLIGSVIYCIPFIRYKSFQNINFRLFILASLLIWSMIFNHIAESASYVVAVFGVAIWFVTEEKNKFTNALMIFAFIFTIQSATDLFPRYIRMNFVIPYVLKAFPCIVIWCLLQYRLLTKKFI